MKKSNSTKKVIIAVLMILTICLYFVSGTYARYTWKGEATSTVAVAKWQVGLTDSQVSETTVALQVNQNEDVVDGKIAPAKTATGEIVINPEGSEVAIDYTIKIDLSAYEDVIDLDIDGTPYIMITKEDGSEEKKELEAVQDEAGNEVGFKGTIALKSNAENKKVAFTADDKVTVHFGVIWNDDTITAESADLTFDANGYGENKDTVKGIGTDLTLEVPVTVLMEQHISEATA